MPLLFLVVAMAPSQGQSQIKMGLVASPGFPYAFSSLNCYQTAIARFYTKDLKICAHKSNPGFHTDGTIWALISEWWVLVLLKWTRKQG